MRVYILRGLPGSGKTSFSKVLKKSIEEEYGPGVSVCVFNRDEFRKDFIETCVNGLNSDDTLVAYARENWTGDEEENYQKSFNNHYVNMVIQKKFQEAVEYCYFNNSDIVTDMIVDCTMISMSDILWLVNFWESRWRIAQPWRFYQLEMDYKSSHDVPESVMNNYRVLKEKTQCYWDKISSKYKYIVK